MAVEATTAGPTARGVRRETWRSWPRRGEGRRRLAALGLVVASGALLAACGGSSTSTGSTTGSTASSGTGNAAPGIDPGHVVLPTASNPTPSAQEVPGKTIDPVLAAGQTVVITAGGFVPHRLFADLTVPVTWINDSGAPQQVVFDDGSVHSGVIPPGAWFVWKGTYGIGIGYHSATGQQGVLTLQAGP